MRPPRRRYSSVSRQNQMSSVSRPGATARHDGLERAPLAASSAASSTRQPRPPAPVWLSSTSTRPGWPSSASSRAASRALSHVPESPLGDVHGDDVVARARAAACSSQEVPHRRLGGGGQLRGVVQARVEGVRGRVLVLGSQVSVPADVQADLLDRPALDQRRRQVGRAVGDDCHRPCARRLFLGSVGAHAPVAYGARARFASRPAQTAPRQRPAPSPSGSGGPGASP